MKEPLKRFVKEKCYTSIKGIERSVFYLTALLIIATVSFNNRALFIGYVFAIPLILNIKTSSKRKARNLILITLALVVSTVVIAYLFKTDSTDGRLLIYKLSSEILSGSFPKGIGLNNFDVAYGNAQIAYFKSGLYSQKEFLLADNIRHAYNDYLEIIIELGWIGLFLILAFLITIYFLITNAIKLNPKSPVLLLLACIHVIAISIAALFTFMVYQPHWQCVLLVSLLIVIYFNGFIRLQPALMVAIILTGSLITFHFGHHLIFRGDYEKAEEAFTLSKAGYFDDANEIYREIYLNLEHDDAIMGAYIHSLTDNQEFDKAEKLLGNLLSKDNSSINYNLLGYCYGKQHKTSLAEAAYLNSIYKVPNRFTGRFQLFLLYLNTNQSARAESLGREMLKMPVKVPSKIIEYFKSIVKKELHKASPFSDPV